MNKGKLVLSISVIAIVLVGVLLGAAYKSEGENRSLAQDLRDTMELVETKELENKELEAEKVEQEKELHDTKEELRVLKWINEQEAMHGEGVTYQDYYEKEGLDKE